jgi:uncharacterized protein
MKINLTRIQKGEVDSLPFEFDYSITLEEQFETAGIIEATPIHITGKVAQVSSEMILEMTLTGELTFQCSRCLDTTMFSLNRSFQKRLTDDESDDLETVPYMGYNIDLEETIIEEIVVSLPTQVLCNEDCKGLCPVCGVNLNHTTCDCDKEKINPHFEVLDDFFS